MIIHRMTATFGKLDNETLTLSEGLNILSRSNEAGKSTWAAFLAAMLYGIDTREVKKAGFLPAKTKYKPWSGKAMEGVVELNWKGQNITICRKSKGRVPMGEFEAYDTDSGKPLDFLTADNCGMMLLGVEQSVFTRSAFIGQSAMGVTSDASLEQRLSSLVTTGDESVSFIETEERLRIWKNHVKHNKTGYLPQVTEELEAVEEKLRRIHEVHTEDLSLHARKKTLTEELSQLAYIEKNLQAAEALKKREKLLQSEEALRHARQKHADAQDQVNALPQTEELSALQKELDALPVREEMLRKIPLPVSPEEESCLQVFTGRSPEEAVDMAARDAGKLKKEPKAPKLWWLWLLCAVFLGAGVGLYFVVGLISACAAIPALGCVLWVVLKKAAYRRKKQTVLEENEKILLLYEADSPEGILQAAIRYGESRQRYLQAKTEYEAALAVQKKAESELEESKTNLLTAVRGFAPSIYSLADAASALQSALGAHEALRTAALTLQNTEASHAAIRAAVGDAEAVQAPAEDFSKTHSLPLVTAELTQKTAQLHLAQTTLAQHQGLVESLGDPAALEAEKLALTEKKARLERQNEALTLAWETLKEANTALQSRFSPQVSALAGELFAKMTGGNYDAIRLLQDLSMEVRPSGDAMTHSQLSLSGGTTDQLYLSLRLAICRLVLGENVPIVLDDALVYFDDTRLKQALSLLNEEAQTRQILLFTCQKREQELMK